MQQLSTSSAKLSNYSETNKKKAKKIPSSATPTARTALSSTTAKRKACSGNSYEKGDASGYINLRHLNTLIIYR